MGKGRGLTKNYAHMKRRNKILLAHKDSIEDPLAKTSTSDRMKNIRATLKQIWRIQENFGELEKRKDILSFISIIIIPINNLF